MKHLEFIEELLSFATGNDADGKPLITKKDMSRIQGKRRAEAKVTNKDYTLSLFHKIFGSSKYVIHHPIYLGLTWRPWLVLVSSSTLLTIFGGRIEDIRTVLLEERLPEGWESRVRKPYGLTLLHFNFTVLPVEFGVREADWAADAKQLADSQAAGKND